MPTLVLKTSFLLLLSPHCCLPWLQSYFHRHNTCNFSRLGFCSLSYCKNKATEKKVWTSATLVHVLLAPPYSVLMMLKKNLVKITHTPPFHLHTGLNWQGFGREGAALWGTRSGTALCRHKNRQGLRLENKQTRRWHLSRGWSKELPKQE